MNSLQTRSDPCAVELWFTDDLLNVRLEDGRVIGVPVAWFPRLAHATDGQLSHYELLGGGRVIHWPEVDEDLSVSALLTESGPSPAGVRSARVAIPA